MVYLAFGIGPAELVPIAIILLVLFGAKKLPELARAMGSSINQFKRGLSDEADAEEERPGELTEGKGAASAGELTRSDAKVQGEEKSRVP